MKKNSLTTAVVAGIAGVAGLANVSNAVNLNPDGLGQVLIYPYYGVNAGNITLISVVNTTDSVKAVKVRFLEALNSREVLDFNLYLSPFDVWTAQVAPDGTNGAGMLTTSDRSCTVPGIPAGGVAFRNFAYTGSFDDDQINTVDRTREGHIEMIEMGTVLDTNGAAFNAGSSFADAATHVSGVPLSCATLVNSWAAGAWAGNPTAARTAVPAIGVDNSVPGGLFGAGAIVDVANGTSVSYNPDAIEAFFTPLATTLHTGPGSLRPSLSQAQTSALGDADAVVFSPNSPTGVITLDFTTGFPNAVSSVFMHDAIYNEFNSEPGFRGKSEWVITFPTKRLHLEAGVGSTPNSTAAAVAAARALRRPFTDNADDSDGAGQVVPAGVDAADSLVFDPSGSCEDIALPFFDREEGPDAPAAVVDFSPPPEGDVGGLALCYETNVLTFNQEAEVTAGSSAVLGARIIANNVNLGNASGNPVNAGWATVAFVSDEDGDGDIDNFLLDNNGSAVTTRNQLFGLPVTGFWAANYVNTAAQPGLLANFAGVHKHRGSRFARTAIVTGEGTVTESIVTTTFAAS